MQTPIDSTPTFEVTLPWPPTVNTYWRHAFKGGVAMIYISKDGQAYRTAVMGIDRDQEEDSHGSIARRD